MTPRLSNAEKQLSVLGAELKQMEKSLKEEVIQKMQLKDEAEVSSIDDRVVYNGQAQSKKEFRENIENRLHQIRKEVTKLLMAVNGKVDEEEDQIDSFTKRMYPC
jgi:hypothetical protein